MIHHFTSCLHHFAGFNEKLAYADLKSLLTVPPVYLGQCFPRWFWFLLMFSTSPPSLYVEFWNTLYIYVCVYIMILLLISVLVVLVQYLLIYSMKIYFNISFNFLHSFKIFITLPRNSLLTVLTCYLFLTLLVLSNEFFDESLKIC